MKVKVKWLRHEALHTTFVILQTLSDQIQHHPYYKSKINPKFNRAIDKATSALAEAYSAVGLDHKSEKKKKIKLMKDDE